MCSATTGGEGRGRGHNGGVWEWTSTVWDKHEGFEASSLCPGYSAEFFDGHHNAVVRGKPRLTVTVSLSPVCAHSVVSKIGGSYAMTPRLAGRRAVRNWYQRNYPYAWNGARVAYDVGK